MFSIDSIVRHLRIDSQQLLILLTGDNGVHEEAARITLHLWVRQLGITDINDGLA